MKRLIILALFTLVVTQVGFSYVSPDYKKGGKYAVTANDRLEKRNDCNPGLAQIELNINNVRARLLTSGDVWWDPTSGEGRFIVPNNPASLGIPDVSSIFAGSVWVGGYDPAGNLKLAGQVYRSNTRLDWWPGPLDEEGRTGKDTCAIWDRFFSVKGDNIRLHIARFEASALPGGEPYECEDVPEDVKYWPSFGNPYFKQKYGVDLPRTTSKLAGFYDKDEDGEYNPCNGDYPVIEIRGCGKPDFGDQMIFWIYNDAGNLHTYSRGNPIQMEVQVQAFAYARTDVINNMTFLRYKLINKATDKIRDCYFAKWVDPDLGCYTDDYIGCDTTKVFAKGGLRTRDLMYIYNQDAVDGTNGCTCDGGVPTYCSNIPILGVDYFRGPDGPDTTKPDEPLIELGMSSFTYMINAGTCNPNPAMTDPTTAIEFYRYMSGRWKDGTPVTLGGNGYNPGGTPIKYVFPGKPNKPAEWSMCGINAPACDYRTVQATGPFRLDPGAKNELIVGTVWVPDINTYPCPDISEFLFADDIAQSLFDNCFDLSDGPDAPNMCIVELDQELIINLSNPTNPLVHNNAGENYQEAIVPNPGTVDSLYTFEGYKIYQLAGPSIGTTNDELADINKARIVKIVDVKNGVSKLFNWEPTETPSGSPLTTVYRPILKAEGKNTGISHSFRITDDQFAKTFKNLINNKQYYYTVIAYGHNNYSSYNVGTDVGQKLTYIEGSRNVGKYIATPRKITDRVLNAAYGTEIPVTRVDGRGVGQKDLDVEVGMYDKILSSSFDQKIVYKAGKGPIAVKIFNPLDVVDGDFELRFFNSNTAIDTVNDKTRWELKEKNSGQIIGSERSIDRLNEQLIGKFGISIELGQAPEVGDSLLRFEKNGLIDIRLEYNDVKGVKWFRGIKDSQGQRSELGDLQGALFNYVKSSKDDGESFEIYYNRDPNGSFTGHQNAFFVPMIMTDYKFDAQKVFVGPTFLKSNKENAEKNMRLSDLQNVDIVFTKDKSKWSRCIVVEMCNSYNLAVPGNIARPSDPAYIDMRMRNEASIRQDVDASGLPTREPAAGNAFSIGYGWFPGYAVDVETGDRLNIFYGENSVFGSDTEISPLLASPTGADMMWNPTSEVALELPGRPLSGNNLVMGGQHMIFVAKTKYDECKAISTQFRSGNSTIRSVGVSQITWAGFPMLETGTNLLSYANGLIPNDLTVKLRVNRKFAYTKGTNSNNGLPAYEFSTKGVKASALDAKGYQSALDEINVVPNPYYGFDEYERSKFTNIVKITNLPPKCKVKIYSLDGKFIKEYNRDEAPMAKGLDNAAVLTKQIAPDLEWDMKNSKNIPISSGVYLIHVYSQEYGERVIKWFGVNRQFDPKGL